MKPDDRQFRVTSRCELLPWLLGPRSGCREKRRRTFSAIAPSTFRIEQPSGTILPWKLAMLLLSRNENPRLQTQPSIN